MLKVHLRNGSVLTTDSARLTTVLGHMHKFKADDENKGFLIEGDTGDRIAFKPEEFVGIEESGGKAD